MTFKQGLKYFLFVLLALVIGFFLGVVAGSFLIPKDAGLAGGAIALFYGIGGAILAGLIALLAIRRLGPARFRLAFVAVVVLGLAALVWFGLRILVVAS